MESDCSVKSGASVASRHMHHGCDFDVINGKFSGDEIITLDKTIPHNQVLDVRQLENRCKKTINNNLHWLPY